MGFDLTVRVHDVETDGLPDMEDHDNVGCIAYVWSGAIVSGWPISAEFGGTEDGEQWWEPSEDRHGGKVCGVRYWIKLPYPAWRIGAVGA